MKKKKSIKKLAESSIKILRSGKIKVKKGYKIDIQPFVKESIENSIVSRLDYLISKEDVIIDSTIPTSTTSSLINEIETLNLVSKVDSAVNYTIIVPVMKKQISKLFDFTDNTAIGNLLRISTLASIYTHIKEPWIELNIDNSNIFTNIMYIPNIKIFLDFNTGKIKENLINVNLLILAFPEPSKMVENNLEEMTTKDISMRVIADIMDASIKCGCNSIIINPYNKLTRKDRTESAELWKEISSSQRVLEHMKSILFSIPSESEYIIFNSVMNKSQS